MVVTRLTVQSRFLGGTSSGKVVRSRLPRGLHSGSSDADSCRHVPGARSMEVRDQNVEIFACSWKASIHSASLPH